MQAALVLTALLSTAAWAEDVPPTTAPIPPNPFDILTSPVKSAEPEPDPHPRLQKTPIGACGCAFYAPEGTKVDEPTLSEDGSQVWTSEADLGGGFHAGVVAVKFHEAMPELTPAERGELLEMYMKFLEGQLNIVGAVGVGRGHTLPSDPSAVGVIDYWKDANGAEWAVKGWINAERLAVMYVWGPRPYGVLGWKDMFLDGFRFTADGT